MRPVEPTAPESHSSRGKRFIVNLLWEWMGVAAALFSGLLLSPYIIRKLTPEGYGVWLLAFAIVDNYVFLDLGFRSATVKYVAHYWARGEPRRINEILSTAVTYAGIVACGLFLAVLSGSAYLDRFFKVSPAFAHSFRILVILVSLNWCLGFVFNNFAASLESVQRFDLYSRTGITVTTVRAVGTALLLFAGYGLVQIGILVVASQALGYVIYFLTFRKIFPQLRISPRDASLATLRTMGGFGIHTFIINISNLALTQGPALLIGHFLPTAFVGYYGAPNRLLMYTGEMVGRVGIITNSNTAELQARGDTRVLPELAVYTNRYCLTLFMPVAITLWLFGARIFQLWVPAIAPYSAPLLPILLLGYVIAVTGQFSSGMLLQGLGRHQNFARGMFVEALLSLGILCWIIPRNGIVGAAWAASTLMILNRGIVTPLLVSREMRMPFIRLVTSIYGGPFLSALPAVALAFWLRSTALSGATWFQIFAIFGIVAAVYYGVALFVCLPATHRALLQSWIARRIPRLRPA